VRERLFEQRGILEAVADPLLEACGAAVPALALLGRAFLGRAFLGCALLGWVRCLYRSGLVRDREGRGGLGSIRGRLTRRFGGRVAFAPPAHLTIENSLLQRTDHGHFHNSQACSPSAMEKKMICARPTRFSSGT